MYKYGIMKSILVCLTLAVIAIPLCAQTENTAPIVWERYKISDQGLSVMLPKMPTVSMTSNVCREEQRSTHFAYAAGVVYEMTIFSRLKGQSRPRWCDSTRNSFDAATLVARLDEIRNSREQPAEGVTNVGGLEVYRFTADRSIRQVIPDLANKRWIELSMTYYPDAKPDVDQFLGSLQFSATGKEIGAGSTWTLGDPVAQREVMEIPDAPAPAETKPGFGSGPGAAGKIASAVAQPGTVAFRIVSKPRPLYTEKARRSQTQGSVRLKVPLLANGSVGDPIVVTALEDGLTDQAIAAARRIVFLPKKIKDVPVSVIVTVEYGFSIY